MGCHIPDMAKIRINSCGSPRECPSVEQPKLPLNKANPVKVMHIGNRYDLAFIPPLRYP